MKNKEFLKSLSAIADQLRRTIEAEVVGFDRWALIKWIWPMPSACRRLQRHHPKAAGNYGRDKGDGESTTYRHSHIGSSMQGERVQSWGCSDGMGLAGILGTACSLKGSF